MYTGVYLALFSMFRQLHCSNPAIINSFLASLLNFMENLDLTLSLFPSPPILPPTRKRMLETVIFAWKPKALSEVRERMLTRIHSAFMPLGIPQVNNIKITWTATDN